MNAKPEKQGSTEVKSLKLLSSLIMNKLKELKTTTLKDIQSIIMNDFAQKGEAMTEATLHRRIYDIINIFSVAGLISKDAHNVTWIGSRSLAPARQNKSPELQTIETRIAVKEENLRYKLKLLLLYHSLMELHQGFVKPTNVNCVDLPCVLLGYVSRTPPNHQIEEEGKKIIITANIRAMFSPLEVLENKEFPTGHLKNVFQQIPLYNQYRAYLEFDDEEIEGSDDE